jgi:KDEL-tailed cysteine endopeptidase
MRVLQLCLAIALASVAAGFPIQDHKLFVQQALISPREAFDFWAHSLEKVYANVGV